MDRTRDLRLLMAACLAAFAGLATIPGCGRDDVPLPASGLVRGAVQVPVAVPPEVIARAQAGLPQWLARIADGLEDRYGFASRSEMERAVLGAPWQMWTIPGRDLADAAVAAPEPVPLDEWRVPILCDGTARALLTVARTDGGDWEVVEIGAAGLAQELDRFESDTKARQGGLSDARRVLLRLHASRLDFLSIESARVPVREGRFSPTRWMVPALEAEGAGGGPSGLDLAEVVRAGRRHFQKEAE
mgnify:CR=1 FL=1